MKKMTTEDRRQLADERLLNWDSEGLLFTGGPSCRHVLVAMGFFALFSCNVLRFKLSVAIVAMVNLTYVREYDAAAQRLWNSSDVGSSRYSSDDLCVAADENTTGVVDDEVRFITYFLHLFAL